MDPDHGEDLPMVKAGSLNVRYSQVGQCLDIDLLLFHLLANSYIYLHVLTYTYTYTYTHLVQECGGQCQAAEEGRDLTS